MFFKRQVFKPLLPLFFFFFFILVLGQLNLFRPVRGFLEKELIVPARERVYGLKRFFKKELPSLDCQRAKAELLAKIALLTEENLAQKKLLSAPLPKNWQFMPVKVIGLQGEVLVIDRGSNDGVKAGMPAVLGETYLGKTAEVSPKMAKINLAAFYDAKLAVKILAAGERVLVGRGLLIGRGEGKMKAEQILSNEGLAKGQLVMTSFAEGDLLVGEIEEIALANGDLFQTALVKRLFNPEELNTIFLIKGSI